MDVIAMINRYVISSVKAVAKKVTSKISKLKKLPQSLAKKSGEIIRAIIDFLIKKPQSADDYVKFPKSYVAKRFIGRFVVLFSALILIILLFAIPFVKSSFFTQHLIVNTVQYHTANGKAEVYTIDNTLLYTGDMKDGKSNGEGKLFDNNNLVYQGGFIDNEYCGYGNLFYSGGGKEYSGMFENSLYNGEGTLYYPSGNVKAEGTFVNGVLNGKGTIYDEVSSNAVYTGELKDGLKEGTGSQYDPQTGKLIYKGEFVNDLPCGNGEIYEDGKLVYKGELTDGLKDGEGSIFDPQTGELIYTGELVNDLPSGEGEVYEDGKLVYKGGLKDGVYDGEGEIYEDGELVYKGGLKDGVYDGEGEIYEDGELVYKGGLKDGVYDGEGELYEDGNLVYEGGFKDGDAAGDGVYYGDSETPVFTGHLSGGQIDYYPFIGANKEKVTSSFHCTVTEKEVDGALLLYYSDLKVGFLFKGTDTVDRMIFTGSQVLYDTGVNMEIADLPPELTAGTYSKYEFTPTSFEKKLMEYMNIKLNFDLYTEKYIKDNVFVKIYSEGSGQNKSVLFYEIGQV